MMKLPLLTLSAALLTGVGLAVRPQEVSEPPLELVLTIDGRDRDVSIGEDFEVEFGGRKHTCHLERKPTRQFDFHGVRLRYPSHFTFEYDDEDDGVEMFTLEGPETLVMLQFFADGLSAEALLELVVDSTVGEYEDFDVERAESEIELGGTTYESQSLTVSLGELRFQQDFVAFGLPEATALLIFQGNLDDDGNYVSECQETFAMVAETLEFAE